MIDARRMEVFTAVYDKDMTEIVKPMNLVLDDHSFIELLKDHRIVFSGNGSSKFQELIQHPNAVFSQVRTDAVSMAGLAKKAFAGGEFADLAYSEPFYLKEFYTPHPPQHIRNNPN
jgi:tRNA threonylcarbamoyladenosine biosynthesis protein TsaB